MFCCRLIEATVDFDDLMVFLPSHCQMTAQNYICRVSIYMAYINFYFRVAFDK